MLLVFIVVVIPGHNLGNSQVSVNRTIGPIPISGRESASGAEGRGVKFRPRHTKGVKNCTSGYLAWCSELCPPPPARVGRHIVFPLASVCLCVCVCLSVTKSCPLYNLITVTDISTKLHTFVKHIETMCYAQEP